MLLVLFGCSPSTDLEIRPPADDTAADSGDGGDNGGDSGGDSGDDSGGDSGEDSGDDSGSPLLADVFLSFGGSVVTVTGTSTWFADVPRKTPISGSLGYAARTPDQDDGEGGWYPFQGASTLEIQVGEHLVVGSWDLTGHLDGYGTFRFIDGTELPENTHSMTVDGTPASDLGLWTAFTNEALFPGEALPDPFPEVDPERTPHTFFFRDEGGQVLIQLDRMGPMGG